MSRLTVDRELLELARDILRGAHSPEVVWGQSLPVELRGTSAADVAGVLAGLDAVLAHPPALVNDGKRSDAGGIPWRGEGA